MKEYEVLKESINPCGGEEHAIKEFLEIETDDPVGFVTGNTRFPLMEQGNNRAGDLVITCGDGKGYFVRYTFTEL
ncbi:MAG: hypothetical protein E7442_08705 [Ruminococcaceae bacterium]|nr:hypothetical protein [Oscillospiraceae bacterium]